MVPIDTGVEPKLGNLNAQAVIFDIYGTLLISGSGDVGPASAEQSQQALREALSASGLPVDPDAPPATG